MGILNDLRTRVQYVNDGLQTGELVRNVIVQHPDDILDLQKMQLFQGLAANGQDIIGGPVRGLEKRRYQLPVQGEQEPGCAKPVHQRPVSRRIGRTVCGRYRGNRADNAVFGRNYGEIRHYDVRFDDGKLDGRICPTRRIRRIDATIKTTSLCIMRTHP